MSAELPYQIEQELRLGTPRPARVKRQEKIALVWLAGIGLIVALVIGWFAFRDISDLYTLRTRGVTAQGGITDKRKFHGKSDSYYLSYSLHTVYINMEEAQIQTCSVSVDIGKQLAADQTVTVLYDAANPRRSCLYCALRYTEILLDAAS